MTTIKTFENRWESAVAIESEGNVLELVYNKEHQTLSYGTYNQDDPEGTLQVTELSKVETPAA